MNFASDNVAGASKAILAAIAAANDGPASAYGSDPLTAKAYSLLCDVFERESACCLVSTGTAANSLALSAICPPYGAIFCHAHAHVIEDECGAPEMFTGGAKLVGIEGGAGKIAPADFKAVLADFPRGPVRQVQPAALSLSQATESGTLYTCEELTELTAVAHDAGLLVHMDGSRFANALVSLKCTPAEMSWKSGIDVLSFGATKNGALACEAVIFFDPASAASLSFRRKRSGHAVAKGRFLGAQMSAYLEGGHWLDLARAANSSAKRLAQGLAAIPGVRMPWPCQANEVFVIVPAAVDAALKAGEAVYYPWRFREANAGCAAPAGDEVLVRLVTSFATRPADVDRLIDIARSAIGG